MKYVQKILLLVLTLGVVVVFVGVIYSFFVIEKKTSQLDMIIPFFYLITGVFSFFFHLKTLKLYKANTNFKTFETKLNVFWIVNAVFGAALIFIAGFFLYLFYYRFEGMDRSQFTGVTYIIGVPFLLGIWLLLDEAFLYKKITRSKSKILIDSIDDIKGNEEGGFN